MIQPVELQSTLPIRFGGVATTTTAVWETLSASRAGDLERVRDMVAGNPILACCKYNYAPPIHFAVREGHTDLVRFLLDHGGLFPKYRIDGFNEELIVFARDRGHREIVVLLEAVEKDPALAAPCVAPTDDMQIEFPDDAERVRFRHLLEGRLRGTGSPGDVEAALAARPELALDPYQYWGEGVLSGPANQGSVELVGLLLDHGARVPEVSKWCARYYFKHFDVAALLLERGMNPNHMNWHHVTLLHDLAWAGDVRKAELLLDHGAELDPVDEEYRSTPLGVAARAGQRVMVEFLLSRGADAGKGGAAWSSSLAWARSKGHSEIEKLLT